MKTLKVYRASAQSSNGGTTKGSVSNPYTKEEFNRMIDAGTWNGGYVEGMGYVLPEVDIDASSDSFSDFDSDSWSDPWGSTSDPWEDFGEEIPTQPSGGGGAGNNSGGGGSNGNGSGGTRNPYPQTSKTIDGSAGEYLLVENVGAKANFFYNCSVSISGYTMKIGASVNALSFTDRIFWATAVVKSNNGKEQLYSLTYSKQGYIYPSGWSVIGDVSFELPKSGNVTVDLCIGFNYDTGTGISCKSDNIHIYPFK